MTPTRTHRSGGTSISGRSTWTRYLRRRADGQSIMEYALFLGLLSLALLGAIALMSGDISDLFTTLANRLANSIS